MEHIFREGQKGAQTTKQQVQKEKNHVSELKQTLQQEKDTNEALKQRVKRQSKTVIAEEEKQIRETAQAFTTELFTLKILKKYQCDTVILKANSPSCGSQEIYDGNFTGNKKKGVGV
uniref:DUF523 domain-containing protein n=1 Tax=Staphylococcus aureus TaxID=1280 RepID=UPI00210E4E86